MKTGAKVISHGRYDTFRLAEVAVPRELFRKILSLFDDLRSRPAPAQAGEIDGQVKTTGGVCLNGEKSAQMAFQTRTNLQNQAIGWLRKGCSSLGGGMVVRFSRIWMSSGECRIKHIECGYDRTGRDKRQAAGTDRLGQRAARRNVRAGNAGRRPI